MIHLVQKKLLNLKSRAQTLITALAILLFAAACENEPNPTTLIEITPTNNASSTERETTTVRPTVAPLQPTFTPADLGSNSQAPQPTQQTAELPLLETQSPTVDLNQPVLLLTYQIPAIQLNRKLEANVAGQLTLIDVTTGSQVRIPNGQRFLTEIIGAIEANKTSFTPVAPDCSLCVTIGYELPAAGESASGALPDPLFQVSIQNLFASRLGAHFPPNTVVGHHRAASGYTVAHTAALTADGKLYRWVAADSQVQVTDEGLPTDEALAPYTAEVETFSGVDLVAACPNFPNEVIVYQDQFLQIRCPELALGQALLDAYAFASDYSQPLLDDERNLPIPETRLPANARLFYAPKDGRTLTIFADGNVTATYPVTQTQPITGTDQTEVVNLPAETINSSIPAGEIEPLIIPMLASDVIPRGVTVSLSQEQSEYEELIFIRASDGVYEFAWSDGVGQELLPGIQILDLLLERLRP